MISLNSSMYAMKTAPILSTKKVSFGKGEEELAEAIVKAFEGFGYEKFLVKRILLEIAEALEESGSSPGASGKGGNEHETADPRAPPRLADCPILPARSSSPRQDGGAAEKQIFKHVRNVRRNQ